MSTPISDASLTISEDQTDRAVLGIILSNVFAIAVVLLTNGGLLTLLWPYWAQSLVIGFYARRRILARGAHDSRGTASLFVLHYGIFHIGYCVFFATLTSQAGTTGVVPVNFNGEMRDFAVGTVSLLDAVSIVAISISFIFSHRASHREHLAADVRGQPKVNTLVAIPYVRIIPMQVIIILGVLTGAELGLVLFGGLKTAADVIMHKVEHRMLQRS